MGKCNANVCENKCLWSSLPWTGICQVLLLLLCCCVVFDCLVCMAQEQEILWDYTWHCFKPSTEQELSLCVPSLCVMFSLLLLFCQVLLFNFLHIKQFGKNFCTRLKTCARILHKYLHNQPECHNKHSSRVDSSRFCCCCCCCCYRSSLHSIWRVNLSSCRVPSERFSICMRKYQIIWQVF